MRTIRARRPAVAGTFYPAEPRPLRAALHAAFADARVGAPVSAPDWPKAVVVPHAGYRYSAAVAASAYRRLSPARSTVERVVVAGPAHRVALEGIAVPTVDLFLTPLGPVRVDDAGRSAVLGHPAVVASDEAHAEEHSLEVQLPFVQSVLGDVEVLPLVVGVVPAEVVADVFDLVWDGRETVFVISSDLSHHLPIDTARVRDRATAAAIEDGRAGDVGPYDACGASPLRGLMVAAARHGLVARTIDLRTSGDTVGGRDHVVGYGAFVVD